jgi:hypothetical protein
LTCHHLQTYRFCWGRDHPFAKHGNQPCPSLVETDIAKKFALGQYPLLGQAQSMMAKINHQKAIAEDT